jgi:AraC-like DNA-binding protein
MADEICMIGPAHSVVTRAYFAAFVTSSGTNAITTGKNTHLCGITFTPLGAWKIFQLRPADFINEVVRYEEVTNVPFPSIFEKHIDQSTVAERLNAVTDWLLMLMRKVESPFTRTDLVLRQLHHGILSPHLPYAGLPLSRRQVERISDEILGMSPKFFQRLSRFSIVMGMLNSGLCSLEDIAFRCGFVDASHLRKDVQFFAGTSIRDLFKKPEFIQDKAYRDYSKVHLENSRL